MTSENIILKIIKWYLKRIVRQGPNHRQNIIDFYSLVSVAARSEFREDTIPMLDQFLVECHQESLQGYKYKKGFYSNE